MDYTVVLHLSKDVALCRFTVINNSSENVVTEKENMVMYFAHLQRDDQLSTCDNSVNSANANLAPGSLFIVLLFVYDCKVTVLLCQDTGCLET